MRKVITKYLKPYSLKMFFSNKYVSAQVVHTPTNNTVASASTQERYVREMLPCTADLAAAALIGKLLAKRMKFGNIPGVSFELARGERYHGKRKALVDSLRDNGIKLI